MRLGNHENELPGLGSLGAGVSEFWGRIHSLGGLPVASWRGISANLFATVGFVKPRGDLQDADLFRGYLEGGDLTRNVSNEVDEFGGVSL